MRPSTASETRPRYVNQLRSKPLTSGSEKLPPTAAADSTAPLNVNSSPPAVVAFEDAMTGGLGLEPAPIIATVLSASSSAKASLGLVPSFMAYWPSGCVATSAHRRANQSVATRSWSLLHHRHVTRSRKGPKTAKTLGRFASRKPISHLHVDLAREQLTA